MKFIMKKINFKITLILLLTIIQIVLNRTNLKTRGLRKSKSHNKYPNKAMGKLVNAASNAIPRLFYLAKVTIDALRSSETKPKVDSISRKDSLAPSVKFSKHHLPKTTTYGRGVGYALWNEEKCKAENKIGCEKWGLIWYPRCECDYENFGCCICTETWNPKYMCQPNK